MTALVDFATREARDVGIVDGSEVEDAGARRGLELAPHGVGVHLLVSEHALHEPLLGGLVEEV